MGSSLLALMFMMMALVAVTVCDDGSLLLPFVMMALVAVAVDDDGSCCCCC